MTSPTTVRYEARGDVRRGCGHRHKTIRSALKCAERDQAACRRLGGYSDRGVRRVGGEPLSEAEDEELSLLIDERRADA